MVIKGHPLDAATYTAEGGMSMGEALREMTYDEQIADFIMHILAIETPFSVKRDLISHLLSLTYRHERDIKDALYTPTPSCSFKAEEGK